MEKKSVTHKEQKTVTHKEQKSVTHKEQKTVANESCQADVSWYKVTFIHHDIKIDIHLWL
jgi:formate dehydrogenase maturation protein FdhE